MKSIKCVKKREIKDALSRVFFLFFANVSKAAVCYKSAGQWVLNDSLYCPEKCTWSRKATGHHHQAVMRRTDTYLVL